MNIVKNRRGLETQYQYDDSNNVVLAISAMGGETTFTFDEMNNKTVVENADGTKEKYAFDKKGNNISEQKANGKTITMKYVACRGSACARV